MSATKFCFANDIFKNYSARPKLKTRSTKINVTYDYRIIENLPLALSVPYTLNFCALFGNSFVILRRIYKEEPNITSLHKFKMILVEFKILQQLQYAWKCNLLTSDKCP